MGEMSLQEDPEGIPCRDNGMNGGMEWGGFECFCFENNEWSSLKADGPLGK